MTDLNRQYGYALPYCISKKKKSRTAIWMIGISLLSIIISFLLTAGINTISNWPGMLNGDDNSVYRPLDIERQYQALQRAGWRGETSYYNHIPR
jgi:hypothetical protein